MEPTKPVKAPERERRAFALARLRRSVVLQACMGLAFIEYGALVILVVFGERVLGRAPLGAWFTLAGWLAVCSLGSWFFLFLWYPALARMEHQVAAGAPGSTTIRVLEAFAVTCVAVVHLVLAWTLVLAATAR